MRSDEDPWADDLDETDDPADSDMDDSEDAEDDDDSSIARKPLWIWIAAGVGLIVILTWILGHGPF